LDKNKVHPIDESKQKTVHRGLDRRESDFLPCPETLLFFKGNIMNRTLTTAIALALTTLAAGNALAAEPVGKTRAEVRAELVQAQRTGDIVDSEGQKLNALFPGQYPAQAQAAGKTRAEVQIELIEAQRTGDIVDSEGQKLNALFPSQYPTQAQAGRSRDEVKQELAEAIRKGDVVDSEGRKLNQLFPGNYSNKG
jgi:hypothetical protein